MRQIDVVTDSYVHVYNRGNKRMPIFRREGDLLRFVYNLFYLNHTEPMPEQWKRDLQRRGTFHKLEWPEEWGQREPLVSVLAYSIMPNHFHLLLKPLVDGGISKFMQRVCISYAKYINEKYNESGGLFQGRYKSQIIMEDFQFQYLVPYITVKNPFELYPGGLDAAIRNFDDAYGHALDNPLTSLGEQIGLRESKIIDRNLLYSVMPEAMRFESFARECMLYKLTQLESAARLDGQTSEV